MPYRDCVYVRTHTSLEGLIHPAAEYPGSTQTKADPETLKARISQLLDPLHASKGGLGLEAMLAEVRKLLNYKSVENTSERSVQTPVVSQVKPLKSQAKSRARSPTTPEVTPGTGPPSFMGFSRASRDFLSGP